jgi:hypothetical protein
MYSHTVKPAIFTTYSGHQSKKAGHKLLNFFEEHHLDVTRRKAQNINPDTAII